MRTGLLAALLAGCGFTTPADPRVVFSIDRASIGTTVTTVPEDLSALSASYLQVDPTAPGGMRRLPAAHLDAMTWLSPVETPLPVEFQYRDYPEPLRRVWDYPVSHLHGLFAVLEHPGATPAPSGSTLALAMTLDRPVALGERYDVYTVGSWATTTVPANVNDTQLGSTFSHAAMTGLSGRPLAAIRRDDAVLLLRYVGSTLTGAATAAPFDETGADFVSGTMTPVIADHMTDLALDPDAAIARLAGAAPAVGSFSTAWAITAAPGAQIGQSSGPLLAAGSIPAGTHQLATTYGNPFADRGWPSLVQWNIYSSRLVQTKVLPVTLSAGFYEYRLADAPGAIDLPGGLPQGITLDGKPLSTDNQELVLPAHPLELAFSTDRPDTSLVYGAVLYEMVPSSDNTALTYKYVMQFMGPAPHFTIPADLLAADKLYVVRATAVAGGYVPGALDDGDLTQRALPFAVGYFDAGVFTVRQAL